MCTWCSWWGIQASRMPSHDAFPESRPPAHIEVESLRVYIDTGVYIINGRVRKTLIPSYYFCFCRCCSTTKLLVEQQPQERKQELCDEESDWLKVVWKVKPVNLSFTVVGKDGPWDMVLLQERLALGTCGDVDGPGIGVTTYPLKLSSNSSRSFLLFLLSLMFLVSFLWYSWSLTVPQYYTTKKLYQKSCGPGQSVGFLMFQIFDENRTVIYPADFHQKST